MEKHLGVFHTHIEIYPYTKKEFRTVENSLSTWNNLTKYNAIGYHIENSTLYVPRGYNITMLEKECRCKATIYKTFDCYDTIADFNMTFKPRNDMQERAINFLCCNNEFMKNSKYSQFGLILETGAGKTFITISSISKLKLKTMIITHRDNIKEEWIKTFRERTDIDEDRYLNVTDISKLEKILSGEKPPKDIYIITHSMITAYAAKHGWMAVHELFKKLHIGIKIYDEAHLAFKNILRIDMFSNSAKTFYLTADFKRSDPREASVYRKVFSSVIIFDEKAGGRKHIVYIPILYRSNPGYDHLAMCMNSFGFSVLGYADYIMNMDDEKHLLNNFRYVLDMIIEQEGKILITIAKIEHTNIIRDLINKEYKWANKMVATMNSTNKKNENLEARNADIICTTIKSAGTGMDIPGLRFIINMEPFSSQVTANQLSGRLREYAPDKDTYFFDIMDIDMPSIQKQIDSRIRLLKKKCKEIKIKYSDL